MTTKHTPGPWHVEWAMAQGGEGHHVCDSRDMAELSIVSTVHFHDDTEGETKANARLVAAAPELLDSLRECVAAYEAHRDNQPTGHLWPDPNHIFHARAAIANATGD